MVNIRTIILLAAFALLFVLAAGELAARSDSVTIPDIEQGEVSTNRDPVEFQYSYRSRLGESRDMSLREIEANRSDTRQSTTAYRSRIDENFDQSLVELARAQMASVKEPQSDILRVDVCFDVSLRDLANCRDVSFPSAP